MQVAMAIGTVAVRFEKQEDEILMEVFILCEEMAGKVCSFRINLLLVGMEWNMFQEAFQFAFVMLMDFVQYWEDTAIVQ